MLDRYILSIASTITVICFHYLYAIYINLLSAYPDVFFVFVGLFLCKSYMIVSLEKNESISIVHVYIMKHHYVLYVLLYSYFTCADWSGKLVGVPKRTWMNALLSLSKNHRIIHTHGHLLASYRWQQTPVTPISQCQKPGDIRVQGVCCKSANRSLCNLRLELVRATRF